MIDGADNDCDGTGDDFSVAEEYGGISILGTDTAGAAGMALATGDIDADGLTDLAILQTSDLSYSDSGNGAVHLLLNSQLQSAIAVSDATYLITASSTGSLDGVWFSSDLDSDGTAELLVAASNTRRGTNIVGSVGLFLTSDLGSTAPELTDADRLLEGEGGDFGSEATSWPDMDGDGIDELVIGAPGDDAFYLWWSDDLSSSGTFSDGEDDLIIAASSEDTRAGRVHVILGSELTAGTHDIASIDYVSYGGASINGYAGRALASGGDVDGDGMHDILIGGPGNSNGNSDSGEAWSVLSGESGDRALVNASSSFYGSADEQVGSAVGMADINNDGLFDLLIGAPGESSLLTGEGAVYIGISSH